MAGNIYAKFLCQPDRLQAIDRTGRALL